MSGRLEVFWQSMSSLERMTLIILGYIILRGGSGYQRGAGVDCDPTLAGLGQDVVADFQFFVPDLIYKV
jgi:hypothetical protein